MTEIDIRLYLCVSLCLKAVFFVSESSLLSTFIFKSRSGESEGNPSKASGKEPSNARIHPMGFTIILYPAKQGK